MKVEVSVIPAYCALCYFQYLLQLTLKLLLILFTIEKKNKENVSVYDYVYQITI